MIKVPKEVARIMKTLGDAGFENYVVGECVLQSLMGEDPYSWDVITKADFAELVKLFPDATVLSEKYSTLRYELIDDEVDEEGNLLYEEGYIIDISTYRAKNVGENVADGESIFADNVEGDLARRDFPITAIAINPFVGAHSVVDPYEGREDIRKKLVRSIGDPDEAMKAAPIRMMKAIRYASEYDFDLQKSLYDAITRNYKLLENAKMSWVRDEFTDILSGKYAGKGLNMLMSTGIVRVILGEQSFSRLTRREKSDMMALCDGITNTKQVPERRLGLFYSIIDKKRSMPSITKLGFDPETHQHLVDAVHDMPKLYFTTRTEALKKFIYKRGMDRYEYLLNLEKAQRLAFGYDSQLKIEAKMYLLNEIKNNGEVIFPEDLVIDANDLIEAGICTEANADKMILMLTESTHIKPKQNTREELFKVAKRYKRNKIAAMGRGIKWLR